MDEIDILKWAAGAKIDLPNIERMHDDRILYLLGIDEEKLIALLDTHRLSTRFLKRFSQERPTWCSRTLLANMQHQSAEAEKQTLRQTELIREVASAVATKERPLIVIKGCSTYALTGDRSRIRLSADLDIVCSDPDLLFDNLRNRGFAGTRYYLSSHELADISEDIGSQIRHRRVGTGGEHELAILDYEGIRVELQRYHPVFSYPAGVLTADMLPSHHPSLWRQDFPEIPRCGISYEDLLHYRTDSEIGTDEVAFSSPAMAAFIFCTHIFKHCSIAPPGSGNQLPAMKLVELADVVDLVRHPDFNQQHFQKLVEKYAGQDAMNLVAHLLQAFLGFNVLPQSVLTETIRREFTFPRALTWWRCWAGYTESISDLLYPYYIDRVVAALGPNIISSASSGESKYYSLFTEEDEPITRVLVHSEKNYTIPCRFCVQWREDVLSIEIQFLQTLRDANYQYTFELRGCRYADEDMARIGHGFTITEGVLISWPEESTRGFLTVNKDGLCTILTIVWNSLPKHVCKEPFLPVLFILSIQDICQPYQHAFDPMIIVPLHIMRCSEPAHTTK